MDNDEVKRRILDIERRLSVLENAQRTTPRSDSKSKTADLDDILPAKVDDIGTQDLVIIALRLNNKLTKAKLKRVIGDWGKAYGDWFTGGNFNTRLVKRGIVKLEETKDNDEDVFSLTKKGEKIADELIAEIMK